MTRHDDRQRIRAVRGADGATCGRFSDRVGDVEIRLRPSVWNRAQLVPHAEVKWSAARRQRKIECASLAGEVFAKLRRDVVECRVVAPPIVLHLRSEMNLGDFAALVLRDTEWADRRIENREDRHALLHRRIAAYARHGRHASARASNSRMLQLPAALRNTRSPSGNASGSPRRIAMYLALPGPSPRNDAT